MSSINRVLLMGRLTRDPEIRKIGNNSEVADIGLACSEWVGSKDGERKERTTFVDVVAWDRQASACGEYLRKGMQAVIEGRLQLDEWTDKQSGERRTKLRVRADRVHFVNAPRNGTANGADAGVPSSASRDMGPDEPAEPPARTRPHTRAMAR